MRLLSENLATEVLNDKEVDRMKYMGSKARIVHEILPIMLDKEHDTFVDAFCGGCSVIENVPDTYRRIANDKNRYLIEMWKHLQNDGFVFSHISKETYDKAEIAITERIISLPKLV